MKHLAKIAVPILTSIVTILLVIPGEQGESALQIAIEALKQLL